MALIKKEIITCVQRVYKNDKGEEKKYSKTIGEILTWEAKNGGHFKTMKLFLFPELDIFINDEYKKNELTNRETDANVLTSLSADDDLSF